MSSRAHQAPIPANGGHYPYPSAEPDTSGTPEKSSILSMVVASMVFVLVVVAATAGVLAATGNFGSSSPKATNGASAAQGGGNSPGGAPTTGVTPGAPGSNNTNGSMGGAGEGPKEVPLDNVVRPLPAVPKGKLSIAWNEDGSRALARGYDGYPWEAVPNSNYVPAIIECAAATCTLSGQPFVIEEIAVPAEFASPSADLLAAQLLSQGTFGATLAEVKHVASKYANNASGWIRDQMAMPKTLARRYFRQRVNPRVMPKAKYTLPEDSPCMLNTRWHEYAFETRDIGKDLVVTADNTNKVFVFTVDGTIRTTTDYFAGEYFPGPSSLLKKYEIEDVRDGINSTLELKGLKDDELNPVIKFTPAAAASLGTALQVLSEAEVAWSDIVGGRRGSRVMSWRGPACSLVETSSGDAFVRYGAENVYLRFDKRVRLWRNTLQYPSNGGIGECPIAARTWENRDHCVMKTSCGVNTTLTRGVEITLDEGTLKTWHSDPETPRYVYRMEGLRLEREYAVSFCSSIFSRWLKVTSCTPTTFQNSATLAAVQAALAASTDTNPYIRDVSITALGCDSDDAATVGAFVQAGGSCWQHVHPDTYSVHDATQWAVDHDGNSAAMAGGGPNPITKHAAAGRVNLYFPASHTMFRWTNRKMNLPYIGRYGDSLTFGSLEVTLQTARMAARLNATVDVSGHAAMTCGSKDEVENDPTLGYHYHWDQYAGSTVPVHSEFDLRHYYQHQRALQNVALKADDQLRQRVAWALSNLLVIGGPDSSYAEGNLKWYDLFIEHAFGNFHKLLTEVTFSSRMMDWLTYRGSRSTESRNGAGLPDENYAREIMQLFSIGLWKLQDDGTQLLDEKRFAVQTYSADDIMDFARVFTGFDLNAHRLNEVDRTFRGKSMIDSPNLRVDVHDMLPKGKLDDGHIGDYVPLCDDLGPQPWLQKGARFEFTGLKSFEGPDIDDAPADAPVNQRTRFTPAQDGSSALYRALCAAPSAGGRCEFPMIVTLPSKLTCAGDQECNSARIAVVAIVDPVANVTKFYRFIEPPCVRLTFFENGMLARYSSSYYSSCSAPEFIRGAPACCASSNLRKQLNVKCRFANEMMSYPQAKALCESNGLEICDYPAPTFNKSCSNITLSWTNKPCSLQIQVYDTNRISIYDPKVKRKRFGYNSFSFFRARWNGDKVPAPERNGECPADSPCRSIATGDSFSCICNITVSDTMPYASVAAIPTNATVDAVASSLFIGAAEPARYGTYTQCTSAACNAFASSNVKIWLNTGDTEGALSQRTIIEIPPFRKGGATRYVYNRLSTVHVGAYSFRNMPNFMPNTGFMHPRGSTHAEGNSWWKRKMEHEVEALTQHLAEHQNTAVFVATHMIKHLATSNPSPRFIRSAVNAFRTGVHGGVTFSGKYGDLGALVHAILMDQEARSTALMADPRAGMVRDPVVKVISALRSLEYKSQVGRELAVDLRSTGADFLSSPTVFGFFDPFYQPVGPLSENGLFAPQAELITSPNMISMLNGFHSLLDNGLMDCHDGLGTNLKGKGCDWRSAKKNREERADGLLNMKPSVNDSATVLNELSLTLTGGRLTPSSFTWTTLAKEYDHIANASDHAEAYRHVAKLVLSSTEFHTTATNHPTKTARPTEKPSISKGRRMKTIIFVNLAGGADTASFLVPFEGCTDEHGKPYDMYDHYKDIRTLSTYDKSLLDKIDAQGSNQPCRYYSMHKSMEGLKKLYDSGDMLWFSNIGGLVEPLTNETYKDPLKMKPKFLYAHNFMQGAMQKVDGLQSTLFGIVGRATDALSSRTTDPYDIWMSDFASSSTVLTGKLNRFFKVSGGRINLLRQRSTLGYTISNMTANVSESMVSNHFASEMSNSLDSITEFDALLKTVPEPEEWAEGSFARNLRKAVHVMRAGATSGKERAGMYLSTGGWDTHSDSDLSEKMGAVSDGLAGLVTQLKADGRWDDTVVVVSSEFGRTGTNNGAGTDHGWGGNNFILGGAVKGGRILGEYPRHLEKGEWVIGRRSVWLPKVPWEGMWKGILEWYGLTNDEIHNVLPYLKNFPADVVFDKAELFK